MKKQLTTVFILLLTTMICLGQENESFKYIWTKGGMNLRVSPNISSKVIGKIPFGDSLIVLTTTQIRYTNLLLENAREEKHSLFLKSHWVEVLVNNKIGYMIDGYLLDIPCPSENESFQRYLSRMAKNNTTSSLVGNFKLRFGHVRFDSDIIEFDEGQKVNYVKESEVENQYFESELRYFQGFNPSELIVFLDPFYNILDRGSSKFHVVRNWVNNIILSDGSSEGIEFMLFVDDVIIMYHEASY